MSCSTIDLKALGVRPSGAYMELVESSAVGSLLLTMMFASLGVRRW